MELIITDNQQYLVRFLSFYEINDLEVFKINPIREHFVCRGRVVGFSRDSSLMIVWNEGYRVYDLAQGIALKTEAVDRGAFAPDAVLDVRNVGEITPKMQVFDALSGKASHILQIPKEEGVSKGFEHYQQGKILGTPYALLDVSYDTTWGEGVEDHLFDLGTGNELWMTMGSFRAYHPKDNILFTGGFKDLDVLEIGKGGRIARFRIDDDYFDLVPKFCCHPDDHNLIFFAKGRDIFLTKLKAEKKTREHYGYDAKLVLQAKMTAWHLVTALCMDETGRYLYISYDNGEIDVFDMQAKHFSEHYRIPFWKRIIGSTQPVSHDLK